MQIYTFHLRPRASFKLNNNKTVHPSFETYPLNLNNSLYSSKYWMNHLYIFSEFPPFTILNKGKQPNFATFSTKYS